MNNNIISKIQQIMVPNLIQEETLAEEPRKIDHKARFKFHDKMARKHVNLSQSLKTGDYHIDMGEKHYVLARHHQRAHYNHTGELLKWRENFSDPLAKDSKGKIYDSRNNH